MTTMITELYIALKSAAAPEAEARGAAEAVAIYGNRFAGLEADMLVLKWMLGATLAGVISIVSKLFFSHVGI